MALDPAAMVWVAGEMSIWKSVTDWVNVEEVAAAKLLSPG